MNLSSVVFSGTPVRPGNPVSALFTLTPAESKRLIAKGVSALPPVRQAMQQGRVIVSTGTTNGYVVEELLGQSIAKEKFLTGVVPGSYYAVLPEELRIYPIVIIDGQVVNIPPEKVLPDFTAEDVFIKGANSLDPQGNVGVLTGNEAGGTIGLGLPFASARGAHLVMPVGLEKMIPSVPEAARRLGTRRLTYGLASPTSSGKTGMVAVVNAEVVTEIVALGLLTGVAATHVASGGVNGAEGSVGIVVEGREEQVGKALELIRSIKGEPNLVVPGV